MLAPPAHGVAGRTRVRGRALERCGKSGDGLARGAVMCANVGRDGSLPLPPLDPYRDGRSEGYEDPPNTSCVRAQRFFRESRDLDNNVRRIKYIDYLVQYVRVSFPPR